MGEKRLIVICCIICIMFTTCTSEGKSFKFNLSDIKNDNDVFCYTGLNWDVTAEETQKALKLDFEEAIESTVEQDGVPSFVSSVYYPTAKIKLNNKVGSSTFEYRDDKLTSLLFSFTGEVQEMKTFSENLIKELAELYSEEYELKERSNKSGDTKTRVYAWTLPYGERASYLQLIVTEKEDSSSVSIGTLCPNKKPAK